MPTTKIKNTLYRIMLPLCAPYAGRNPISSETGHPLVHRGVFIRLIRRHHVLGSCTLLSAGGGSAAICTSVSTPPHHADENTFFRVASITKTATAVLAMRLADRGIIRPDSPVSEYFECREAVSALEGITGPLCITTEGLLMYFNDSETAAMCENIYRMLAKHGGCWITSDPEMMIQNMLVMRAIAGERYQEVMNNLMRGFESKADIHVETPVMMIQPWKNGGKDMEADREMALAFLAGKGLQAERLTVGRYMPEIRSFSALEPEVAERVRAGMEQCAYWKITLKPTEKKDRTDEITAEDFSVRAALTEGRLDLSLTGRVDTLTAPRVLELYEKISEDTAITGIVVDCSKLQYISSAGLRVLLIMQKKHGVKLVAVNSVVMEILETTGFDSILEVEE